MKATLFQRYANEPDLKAALVYLFSDVHRKGWRFRDPEFLVLVPTLKAKTNLAVFGEIAVEQRYIHRQAIWPGGDIDYKIRVHMVNANRTTVQKVKAAISPAELGNRWNGNWSVNGFYIDETLLPLAPAETVEPFRTVREQRIYDNAKSLGMKLTVACFKR
jgi:hypothetical protein